MMFRAFQVLILKRFFVSAYNRRKVLGNIRLNFLRLSVNLHPVSAVSSAQKGCLELFNFERVQDYESCCCPRCE
jgi:hypothetical protein